MSASAEDGGFRERWISAQDGLRLYFRDYGDPLAPGAPLLCLTGLTRNSKDFHDFARRQSRTRRVICPDYRGRGRSDYDDWKNYRPEVYLRDITAVIAATNLHRPVICGTSMGGLLALGLAVTNPTLLAGVILNDSGPDLQAPAIDRIRSYVARDEPLADWMAATAEVKEIHGELGYTDDAKWRQLAEATYRENPDGKLTVDWDVTIAKSMGGPIPDLWPFFRAIRRLPALALRGANSSVLSAEAFAAMLAAKPDLLQVTVPAVGHAPALDEPEAEQAIDAFLATVDA